MVHVKSRGLSDVRTGRTLNISRTGAFVRTDQPASVGTRVELTFSEPGNKSFVVFGEVVRVVPEEEGQAGMGVAFTNVGESTRKRLESLIRGTSLQTERDALYGHPPARSDPADKSNMQTTVVASSVAMDPRTAFNRALKLRATGRAGRALEIAEALVECFPEREDFKVLRHLTTAAILQADGEEARAVTHWEAVLRLDPNNEEARTAIGGAPTSAKPQSGLSRFLKRLGGE
jgi:uncharacterized protein (TIGR02266 family)